MNGRGDTREKTVDVLRGQISRRRFNPAFALDPNWPETGVKDGHYLETTADVTSFLEIESPRGWPEAVWRAFFADENQPESVTGDSREEAIENLWEEKAQYGEDD